MTAWSLKGRNDFLQRLAALAAVPIVAVSLMAGSVSAAAQDEVGLDAALADSDSPPLEPKPQDLESVEGEEEAPAPEELESIAGTFATAAAMGTTTGSGNLKCDEGYYYAIHKWGEVLQLQEQNGAWGRNPINRQSYSFRSGSSPSGDWNGLGVSKDGSTVYAYNRYRYENSSTYGWVVTQVQIGDIVNGQRNVSNVYRLETPSGLIAGAVAPDGTYYFGGYRFSGDVKAAKKAVYTNNPPVTNWTYSYDSSLGYYYYNGTDGRRYYYSSAGFWSNSGEFLGRYWSPAVAERSREFVLYKYSGGQITTVGIVPISTPVQNSTSAVNGDFAFDSSGNMYLLFHEGGTTNVQLIPVLADQLEGTGTTRQIIPQPTTTIQVKPNDLGPSYFNGVSFTVDGYLMIEDGTVNARQSTAYFYKVDPTTGNVVAQETFNNDGTHEVYMDRDGGYAAWLYGGQSDLASCATFSTLELKKTFPTGRAAKADQVELQISRGTGTNTNEKLAWTSTTGEVIGEQPVVAGPVIASPDEVFRLREVPSVSEGTGKTRLSYYKSNLTCKDTLTGAFLPSTYIKSVDNTSSTKREWDVTIPSYSAWQLQCMYENTPVKGDLAWTKVGKESPEDTSVIELGGSVWSLLDSNKQVITSPISYEKIKDCDANTDAGCLKVDKNKSSAKFLVTDLPYGTYYLREDQAPDGYKPLSDPIKFSFDVKGMTILESPAELDQRWKELAKKNTDTNVVDLGQILNLKPQGTVTWKKTDAATGAILHDSTWKLTRLTDASGQKIAAEALVDGRDQFEIKDKTSKTEDATRDTNEATGEFKVEDLPYGKWRLEEVEAPDGYRIVGANAYEFTVNKAKKDVEAVPGGAIKNYKARIEWSKVDAADEKNALAGSEWQLTGPDGKELSVKDCVASECVPEVNDIDPGKGKFSVAELGNGEYTLKETKAPEGYLVTEKTYTFKITDTGYSIDGNTEKKFPVPSSGTNYIPLSIGGITNDKDAAKVHWSKVDAAATSTLLGGSEWSIVPKTSTGALDEVNAIKVTDLVAGARAEKDTNTAAGEFTVELPLGTYVLKETKAPAGYLVSDEAKNGKEFTLTRDNLTKVLEFGSVTNKKIEAGVTWKKVDATDATKLLGGSEWTITPYKADGTLDTANAKKVVDKTPNAAGVLDEDPVAGQFKINALPAGKYRLEETKAPEGYVLADAASAGVDFTVDDSKAGAVVDLDAIKNERMDGVVTWTKLDQSGKALHSSEWTIVKVMADRKPIDGAVAIQVTDCQADAASKCTEPDIDPAGGAFKVDGLEFGEYKLVESKAPAGFVVDTTEHYFTISKNGEEIVAGAFKNELGKGVKLPLTGGLGAFKFLIAGGLLGVLSAAMGGAHVMRRRNS
ncbi:SpaH fimbrial tip protein SpaG [Corynebacterium diphtheriae]|uniref:SpaH fimbrial tip protein SpaG n=1 Tax=Corynebacterium diphtheriae TaxID=1717 RepID=UPI000B4B219A|nr:SpaH fimbrial tip protein SpaG [Corynebacterium diphtheriae]OWO40571.1 collagen-binding protein [Corynebacterium diphtheriae bv. gravis]